MHIDILSIFPEMFSEVMNTSILGRAQASGALEFVSHDLRRWTHDRHRSTDDAPYGGGPGQLMKAEPVFEALDELLAQPADPTLVLVFTAHGRRFDQTLAQELATWPRLVMVCGRYEGFDERVYARADLCVSLGDYILSGGELAAMVVTDALCRLQPGVLGDERSSVEESFRGGLLEYPQYTRPATLRGLAVPEVLLSGNHAAVAEWRRKMSIINTARLRPDLLAAAQLTETERQLASRAQTNNKDGNALLGAGL
ncbi:MAG: tRNA (guanosine(37)-N1)-methyltransferase TrmD [Coriobacteriales bacterium]|jgi:tRNA (guanine37-N1)-methyltransferase|nr:tRNA (guanosine(37)-N1)-methyltransferase TrmD [Coriobacteriales bacterium]